MNKKIVIGTIVLLFLVTQFDSAIIPANSNKAQDDNSKSVVENSSTLWVPQNYTTIQEAIDAAEEGNTIYVRTGIYYEHLIVKKALSLVGETKHGTIIDGNGTGIVVCVMADGVALSDFTIQNGELGIWLRYSTTAVLTGNIVSNNSYGLNLWGSSDNILTGNIVSHNWDAIYLYISHNNTFNGNSVSNNWDGFYLESSNLNVLADNIVSQNNNDGIRLYHSSNNVLSGNTASSNQYGIYVGDSDDNVFTRNTASGNQYGIYVHYSRYSFFTNNIVTDNSRYGIHFASSQNNAVFHNNFINNVEPSSSINSVNSWDNGVEGNYWSDHGGVDANRDGITDTPYTIDENSQDDYPLMSRFLQFDTTVENKSYETNVVCNSSISNFRCDYNPHDRTNTISFEVDDTEETSFCRICIPHTLIEPPHSVTVNYNPPTYSRTVQTNKTHTWLYFTYDDTEHEIEIKHMVYPEQLVLSRWAILGLTVVAAILLIVSIKYYRMFKEQKKVIQAYERELGNIPVSHPERARTHFIKDVIRRKEKIEKFENKYGIKIKPTDTFEDLIKKLGVKKKAKN
jgi:parallel beta-helix repeat protein